MRLMFGLAVSALSLLAQPALAADGAALWGKAPLRLTGEVAARAADLGATALAATPAAALGETMFRKRLIGSGVEYFPVDGSGFHLSASTRLFARRSLTADTEQTRLLGGARGNYGAPGGRLGFRRMVPAMTVGYTRALDGVTSLGLEAGAMMGRAFTGMPSLSRTGQFAFDRNGGANPVVNLVLGHRF